MNTINRHTLKHILAGSVIAAWVGLLSTTVVMWSWNLVLPEVLGVTTLTFRNALGLILLGLLCSALINYPPLLRHYSHANLARRNKR